ncbi:hypothetical protein FSP39_003738 [Pinctada imbricata]|uniref:Urease n=1 Tax=Pinctada imbricata TaxID=66713 RepID=A0AA89C173_PINIB|nr:hypothetical protein FSP39_003738 [Pinctada imbricata]
MKLSPRELESLLVHQAGYVAQKRLARGVRLNHPEATALIASQIQEFIRDGKTVAELMTKGRELLGKYFTCADLAIEGEGVRGVTVHEPICCSDGDLEAALYGSFLPVPELSVFEDKPDQKDESVITSPLQSKPGELLPMDGHVEINKGREVVAIRVTSLCDRPIQVGSHYHFTETNKYLKFDREAAYGRRLNIASGTAIRFEPGETKTVNLVDIGGFKTIRGGNFLCDGTVDKTKIPAIMEKVTKQGFGHEKQDDVTKVSEPCTIPRTHYVHIYGPTVGDKVRLGDTSLIVEVEKDFTVYGEELKFGGGKVLREGMGQASNRPNSDLDVLDTVITNALIVDAVTGIIKADVGIKNGRIAGIGKAGNPDIMDGVTTGMICGAGTEAIAGEGLILTAGALDGHVHFICPQLAREAVASGITTMFGGGTGPATGTNATTCSPGANHIRDMLQSTDAFPLNFGFTGKGNSSVSPGGVAKDLEEQIQAGAMGLKLHEDWGTTPAAIDTCLGVAEKYDVQVMIHTDTLNESACVEQTIEAFKGRCIHTYHSEGAGGGHAPDIIRVCGESNVLPSSTNPTRPYTANTVDEHLDMLMVCHHLDKDLKEDVAFAESRIRAETIAAEDILHDMGAISMMASDSQAMGRIGEVICRTWQTADKMKLFRGKLSDETGDNDNIRVKRYVAKYTVNPAIAHGMGHLIGSVETGKLADLVLWDPAFFGAKPEIIIKGGQIAWAQMGMPNASIPTPQPVIQRKMFGAYGKSVGTHSVVFVSKVSHDSGVVQGYGLSKKVVAVESCRKVTKASMVLNDFIPQIKVDPYSYKAFAKTSEKDEETHLTCPPAARIALAQRYFLF